MWKDVVTASGECAKKAKEMFCKSNENKSRPYSSKIKIAGGLPPLAESYRPDLVGPFENNVLQYRVIVSSLLGYVDLFLCETMSSIEESKSAVVAAVEVMKGYFRFISICRILNLHLSHD